MRSGDLAALFLSPHSRADAGITAAAAVETPLLSKRSILSIQAGSRILIVYYIFSGGGRT